MLKKLNPRERRTVLTCLVISVVLLLYFLILEPVVRDWRKVRLQLASARQKAAMLKLDPRDPQTQQQKRLLEMVPVLEMPKPAEVQGPLLQETFTEQLKKAGLNSKRVQLVRGRGLRTDASGYEVLQVQSQGTGRYDQMLRLLADLPQNGVCAGVQKLMLRADPQNRQNLDWEITVFTFAAR